MSKDIFEERMGGKKMKEDRMWRNRDGTGPNGGGAGTGRGRGGC